MTKAMDTPQDGLLVFLHQLEVLKHLPRSGWVERGIPSPETVAGHSWRLAVLCWSAALLTGLDASMALRIAVVHDFAEALIGDQTPLDGLGLSDAQRREFAIHPELANWDRDVHHAKKIIQEREALQQLLSTVPEILRHTLQSDWEAYQSGSSAEARLVKHLDKFEAYLQGREYALAGTLSEPETLNSFRYQIEQLLTEPFEKKLVEALDEFMSTQGAL